MHPHKIGRLLASDTTLQPVVEKALKIGALSRLCLEFLPPELAARTKVANFKDGQLSVHAATPAAAAKLKLLTESLANYLTEQGAEVNSVSVRVQPGTPADSHRATRQPPGVSTAGLEALRALYARLPDSPARSALKTLLDHRLKPEPDAGAPPPPPAPRRRART